MRSLLLIFISTLFLFATNANAQAIVKGSGIVYTNGAPTHSVNVNADAEVAIDTASGYWYERSRDGLGWILAGFRVQKFPFSIAPTVAPLDKQSEVLLNDVDSLYRWRGGAWRHLNPDGSISNEGVLGVGAGGASSSVLLSNTSGAVGVTINVGGINAITESTSANGGSITITATEIDGSITNELQTLSNSSNATSHTITLSNSGGSTQFVEGTGIGLATTGTTLDGIVTITNTSPDQTVTITNGGGISVSGSYPSFTLTATDQSATNELQTLASTSDATSHTVTLSNSGGSFKLVEGSNITLTTSGTGLDGIITIASTAGSGNYQTLRDDNTPLTGRAAANFIDAAIVTFALTDDAGGGETEIRAGIAANSIGSGEIGANAIGNSEMADNAIGSAEVIDASLTAADLAVNVVSSIDGVTNDGGDIDLVQGGIITITPNDAANTITISAIEVDGSVTNEAWTIDADDVDTEVISNQTVKFQGAGIAVTDYNPATDVLLITATEIDGSITNEGILGVGAGGASSSTLLSTTSGANPVTINVAGILAITESASANGGSITITATEIDGSITNELQTLANTSDATSHTVTLSNSGGSFKLVEGSGITITTTGTGSDGIATIASTAASSSIYTANGTAFPNVVVTVGTGNSVNFAMEGATGSTFNVGDHLNDINGDGLQVYDGGVKIGDIFGASDYYIFSGKGVGGNYIRTPASNLIQDATNTNWTIIGGNFKYSDTRVTKIGLEYGGDYSAAILGNARSIPDIGTVKQIYTAGSGISITPSGNNLVVAATGGGADGNGPYSGNGGNGGNGTVPSVTNSTITNQWTLSRATDDVGGLVPFRISVAAGNEPDFMSFVNGSDSLLISKGDQEFEVQANKTLVIQSTDLLYLIADSLNISNVPNNIENERTLLLLGPSGTIVKSEGLDPDIINQNGAGTNDVLKWNGTKWAPGTDAGGATDLTFTGSGPYTLNSSTGTDVTITQGSGITITRTVNDLSFAAIDASATNELQTLASTSDATSHTITLSNSGGSFKLVEGSNITLTTTGTGLDGIITIASTGGTPTANNGLSDNENSGNIRLGNRYMNSSDGPFSFDRKVNVNAFKMYIGDNTDSTLLVIDGTSDRVGIGGESISGFKLYTNGASRFDGGLVSRGTGTNPSADLITPQLRLWNTTASTGDTWYFASLNNGDFVVRSDNASTNQLTIKDAASGGQVQITNTLRIGTFTGTPTQLNGTNGSGDVGVVNLGSGVTLASGELPLWNSNNAGSVTSLTATALANVTGLSFGVTANLNYEFWAAIKYSANNTTTGSAWSIDCPAGTVQLQVESATANNAQFFHAQNAENTLLASTSSAYTSGNLAFVRGIVEPTSSGTCIIRGATEVASNAITVQGVSNINWREIK